MVPCCNMLYSPLRVHITIYATLFRVIALFLRYLQYHSGRLQTCSTILVWIFNLLESWCWWSTLGLEFIGLHSELYGDLLYKFRDSVYLLHCSQACMHWVRFILYVMWKSKTILPNNWQCWTLLQEIYKWEKLQSIARKLCLRLTFPNFILVNLWIFLWYNLLRSSGLARFNVCMCTVCITSLYKWV